ncbi:MAG: hypothetical protein HC797_09145, partial [Anaerolineales bacterium]|nr:hypothetical protein [Anaerolineales bacterium]
MNNKKFSTFTLNFLTLLSLVSVITFIHWLILIFQIPVLDNLSDWKYKLHITSVEPLWIFIAFLAFGVAILLSISNSSYLIKLTGIILLGTIIQYSFAFSKGDGLNALTFRVTGKGHAEFAKVAVRPISIRAVVVDYESLLSEKYYGYLPSKPPGTLLFYVLTDKAAQWIWPSDDKPEQLKNLANFASMTWPLLSYLSLIPLFLLARYVFDVSSIRDRRQHLFISVPSLNLMT